MNVVLATNFNLLIILL